MRQRARFGASHSSEHIRVRPDDPTMLLIDDDTVNGRRSRVRAGEPARGRE